jgi:hypothetical protein
MECATNGADDGPRGDVVGEERGELKKRSPSAPRTTSWSIAWSVAACMFCAVQSLVTTGGPGREAGKC